MPSNHAKWPELSTTGPYHCILDLLASSLCNRARLHHSFSQLLFTMDQLTGDPSAHRYFKYTAQWATSSSIFFPKHQRTTPGFAKTFLEGLIIQCCPLPLPPPLGRLSQSYPKFIAATGFSFTVLWCSAVCRPILVTNTSRPISGPI